MYDHSINGTLSGHDVNDIPTDIKKMSVLVPSKSEGRFPKYYSCLICEYICTIINKANCSMSYLKCTYNSDPKMKAIFKTSLASVCV